MKTRKAVVIHQYGDAEQLRLEEVACPAPQADQVLVRVHAAGVNPLDWKLRSGHVKDRLPLEMPAILGADVAGVVESVGDDVQGIQVGDEVFAMIGLSGAYASHVNVDASFVAPKPASLSFAEAASVPLAALTAWQGLYEQAELAAGQSVLVQAAAGGVGGFAVQFAHLHGARVIGTASAQNVDYLQGLGADQVIDYRTQAFEEQVSDLDVVVETMGGEISERSVSALKSGGVLVQVLPSTDEAEKLAEARGVRMTRLMVRPDGKQLAKIGNLLDSGQVTTTVAAVFPIEETGKAHAMNADGHTRGKIVLSFGEAP